MAFLFLEARSKEEPLSGEALRIVPAFLSTAQLGATATKPCEPRLGNSRIDEG